MARPAKTARDGSLVPPPDISNPQTLSRRPSLFRTSSFVEERRKWRQQTDGFDIVGFVLVATFLGALEIMLDRGLEDDWFASSFITTVAIVCALAFVLMIPWEQTRRNPTIDVRMVATRQFGACFLVMLATGALLLATTQFLPELVQEDFGYNATMAGVMVPPGGVVATVMMFVAGRLVGKIQAKYLIAAGAVAIAVSMSSNTARRPSSPLRRNRWFETISLQQ
jgi:MFS transporter, DHA2 family, multidrug resistance protein